MDPKYQRTMKTTYNRTSTVGIVSALAVLVSIDANAQVTLNPSTNVTPVTSKPGFIWRIFNNSKNQVNSTQRTEDALAGLLKDTDGTFLPNNADPAAQGVAIAPAKAPATPNAPIEFEIDTVINVDQAAGSNGTFIPDDQMPGIPGVDGSTDGSAVEIITYLDLAVGTYTFGVASDDGFRTSAGNLKDAFQGTVLGEFNGGRGSAETLYTFKVVEAGVYPFRTTYEEGGGGSTIEWYSVKPDGTKTLINDVANGGIKAYRAATTAPQPPYIKSVSPSPAPRQLNGVSSSVVVVLNDGDTTAIDDSSVDFKIDGVAVTDKKRDGKTLTLTYKPSGIQFPNETHTASLTFKGAGGFTRTENWSFRNLKNVILPATALITENFDSYTEGTQPTGWVATNFTVDCDSGEDITNQKSDTYKNWVVITPETANPAIDDYHMDEFNANELLNGKPITIETLRTGKFLYAESDSRCNGTNPPRPAKATTDDPTPNYGQIQFIVTKPYNLSTVKNPVLSFASGYVQNQDSHGACEYSIDGGKTWMPVVIFLDLADIIVNADGTTDGPGTLNAPQTDTAIYTVNGVVKGNSYGEYLASPINASISDYIVPRINDDGAEGKRIEIFRLPAAASQADVRLRFSASGSDSWYWWIDNIGFYDIAPASTPTAVNVLAYGDAIRPSSYNSPGAERVINVADGTNSTKYLNFDKLNTGFTIIPARGDSVITGIRLISANDAPERDPSSFLIEGTSDLKTFTKVATNAIPAFTARFATNTVSFANTAAFSAYRVTFPTVSNATTANSMQVAEVQLLGSFTGTTNNLAFTPGTLGIAPVTGGKIAITFTGVLQSATNVKGPWSDVAGQANPVTTKSPYTNSPSSSATFYRFVE